MPHVIVKMDPATSELHKQDIAEAVTRAIMATTGHGLDAVSVGIEEVQPNDWTEKVFKPDISGSRTRSSRSQVTTLNEAPGHVSCGRTG